MTKLVSSTEVYGGPSNDRIRLLYDDAHSVFSFRRVAGRPGQPVVRLRRLSDGAMRSFSAEDIALNIPIAWAAGSDVTLRTWFNSGRGGDMDVPSGSGEPTFISGGAYTLGNGRVALVADGSDDDLVAPMELPQPLTVVAVGQVPAPQQDFMYLFDGRARGYRAQQGKELAMITRAAGAGGGGGLFAGNTSAPLVGPGNQPTGKPIVWVGVYNGAGSFLVDGAGIYRGNPGDLGLGDLHVGAVMPNFRAKTTINELAIYAGAVTEARARLIQSVLAGWLA